MAAQCSERPDPLGSYAVEGLVILQEQEHTAQDRQASFVMGLWEGWRRNLPEDWMLCSGPGVQSNWVHFFPLLRMNGPGVEFCYPVWGQAREKAKAETLP